MSFFSALYRLLIGPLELFFELLFSMANRIIQNPGLSIIFLSLAMNFLVLPLYRRADAMQEEERETNDRLKHWTTHIKKTFKGDERYMILQTYYRQNNYRPSDALKGSVSLLLEIPFFMAAYNFLSKLPLLHGASLGPIADLGVADGLLVLGGLSINVLPILMTAINLVSSAIYTKGMPAKSKVQLYVMAALFLVLLYDSPAGLVFYWTLNNLFSLVKNIFYKLKNPRRVLCILFSLAGAGLLAFVIKTHPMPTEHGQLKLCCLVLLLQLPLIWYFIRKHLPRSSGEVVLTGKDRATFWTAALFMAVLTGVMIPTTVIHASPEEFINAATHVSPLTYILNSALTGAGFFLVWFGVFYMLASDAGKKWMGYLMCALAAASTVDFMFFGRDYGNMSANLIFDASPVYTQVLLNLAVVAGIALLVFFLWKKKQELFRFVALTAAVAALALSTVNMMQIHEVVSGKSEQIQQNAGDLPVIPLSKNGKNVIVLMMDRAIGGYFPYLLEEKPELREQFAGFTYYPNTVSYGAHTNTGSPALFGGYDYRPEEINKRDAESLESKQNEALTVMPAIFYEQGYTTTVCDPPYAGYNWVPDLSIYDAYPDMNTYNTMGMFEHPAMDGKAIDRSRNRNFYCYSLFRIAPVAFQKYIYDEGRYGKSGGYGESSGGDFTAQVMETPSVASGVSPTFMNAYSVLVNLPGITQISEGSENTFLMLTNDTTHNPNMLQEPDYEPSAHVDNRVYDDQHPERFAPDGPGIRLETTAQAAHYHINMAGFMKLGDWFDHLRAEGVFDNTRIVIVSDHGFILRHFENMKLNEDFTEDVMYYNPILLVKDFGSQELKTDETFMTNADTPALALQGLIEAPVNPFTGNPINMEPKEEGPVHVFASHIWDTGENHGNTYVPGPWYAVHDDIRDSANWEELGVS